MGIRHIEGTPYGTVRSSDQGKRYKALLRPDCRSLLLKQSLSFATINSIFLMLYSMKQTHSCCQLQAGGIMFVMYDSKAQQCLLP